MDTTIKTTTETVIEGNFAIIVNKSGISVSFMFESQTIEEVELLNPKAVACIKAENWFEVRNHCVEFWDKRGMKNYMPPMPFEREV